MLLDYNPPVIPYLDIIFQDDHILVLNKQSGLLSVPGKHDHLKDCLERRVRSVYPTATTIHRLDMATSGLLIMALNRPAHGHIGRQFERRQIKKTYIARVFGKVNDDEGSIDLPLRCDWPNRPKQMVDFDNGRKALTHWKILDRKEKETRLKLMPVTGRSHQLRVHTLAIGHPILGDEFYAHEEALSMAARLQLHAYEIELHHPHYKEKISFRAPLPF